MSVARHGPTWVFGYGSLIYKVDFPFLEREVAAIQGWERRFWQGSHDHRGTPAAPGRVVTLIPSPGAVCKGVAYRIKHEVFEHLDHREKNGYQRHSTDIVLKSGNTTVAGVVYVARPESPAYLGAASEAEVADHIARAKGPSGSNRDYQLQLAAASRDLDDHDPHVQALESLLV